MPWISLNNWIGLSEILHEICYLFFARKMWMNIHVSEYEFLNELFTILNRLTTMIVLNYMHEKFVVQINHFSIHWTCFPVNSMSFLNFQTVHIDPNSEDTYLIMSAQEKVLFQYFGNNQAWWHDQIEFLPRFIDILFYIQTYIMTK